MTQTDISYLEVDELELVCLGLVAKVRQLARGFLEVEVGKTQADGLS